MTEPVRLERTRGYVSEGMRAISPDKIRQEHLAQFGSELEADVKVSEHVQDITALRLSLSFGEEGDCYGNLDEWPQFIGFTMGLMVNYQDLADRLFRQFMPGYVPAEVRETDFDQAQSA